MNKPILVLGATSAVARATAAQLAERGHSLFLAGRNQEALDRNAQDLRIRYGIDIHTGLFDSQNYASHKKLVASAIDTMGSLAGVLVSFGYIGDAHAAEKRVDEAVTIIARNFTGAVSVLTHVANELEARGDGFIVALTAAPNERATQTNYVYTAARAGLIAYLDGLRTRLAPHGVRVITVKPNPLEASLPLGETRALLEPTTDELAKRIVQAISDGNETVYVQSLLGPLMQAVKLIPEQVLKRWGP